jgi:hypothetical protein
MKLKKISSEQLAVSSSNPPSSPFGKGGKRGIFIFIAFLLLGHVATSFAQTATQDINLSWTDNSNNEDGFGIERAADPAGPFTQIGSVGADVTAYVDQGLPPATRFCYRVRAFNKIGFSDYTNVQCGTTGGVPNDPASLQLKVTINVTLP